MINYLIILHDDNISDIVMDFLALYVIAELDDYVFEAHSPDDLSVRIVTDIDGGNKEDLFKIETTSSKFGSKFEEDRRKEYIIEDCEQEEEYHEIAANINKLEIQNDTIFYKLHRRQVKYEGEEGKEEVKEVKNELGDEVTENAYVLDCKG